MIHYRLRRLTDGSWGCTMRDCYAISRTSEAAFWRALAIYLEINCVRA